MKLLAAVMLLAISAAAQSTPASQANNPNYPQRNPFYFEGKVTWELLGISTPGNEWEYVQRGIHYQDDLEDIPNAIADYQKALTNNSLSNNTCQIVTVAVPPGNLTPPPCMFTVRLRLGVLLMHSDPTQALSLFQDVLKIDPLRPHVNFLIGQTCALQGDAATVPAQQTAFYEQAIVAYHAELALNPVTVLYTQLTGDQANNAHVHWELAEIYAKLQNTVAQSVELQNYLKATMWHSDTYPWRIQLAQGRLKRMGAEIPGRNTQPAHPVKVKP
jgi:tetratricopeptide (TPR) repeat protein